MKNLLLIIDAQNDFVDSEGKLYIPGSERAVKNICRWINMNRERIDDIILTQDSHLSFHIGHGAFWKEYPSNGTTITYQDVLEGKYNPIIAIDEVGEMHLDTVMDYFKTLDEKGLKHTIWPEHCILGSWGWAFPEYLIESLNLWSIKNLKKTQYKIYKKGLYPYKEMYSAISYVDGEISSTGEALCDYLGYIKPENIFICGFAKDYCVAETVKDLVRVMKLSDNLIFLDDCMTAINDNNPSLEIYEKYGKKISAVKGHR